MAGILTNLQNAFIKNCYSNVHNTDIEEVYSHGNKVYVFAKDEYISASIYEILQFLKDKTIQGKTLSFTFEKIEFDEKAFSVKWFCINFKEVEGWRKLSINEKLEEMVAFIEDIQKKSSSLKNKFLFNDKYLRNLGFENICNFFLSFEKRSKEVGRKSICEPDYESQINIVNTVYQLDSYLYNLRSALFLYGRPVPSNEFDIEKSVSIEECGVNSCFIVDTQALSALAATSSEYLESQITKIFFMLLLKHVEGEYGKLTSEKEIMAKQEVRYLSPVIAKEFVNFSLEKEVDYEKAGVGLNTFLKFTKKYSDIEIYYDRRFEYNPISRAFVFDYEVEEEYGLKINRDMSQILPDGKTLVVFKRVRKMAYMKEWESKLLQQLSNFYYMEGNIEGAHVKISKIHQIILSTNTDSSGMYYVVGYVKDEVRGNKLTDEFLLTLSNKDFLKVTSRLFNNFNRYAISLHCIWMDSNFNFYIDILDREFKVYDCGSNTDFMNNLVKKLSMQGYNKNSAYDIINTLKKRMSKRSMNSHIEAYDRFCGDHGIYYSSKETACPICLQTMYFVNDFVQEAVFEDEYAMHYRLNSEYNLKVYKQSSLNLEQVAENIDIIVENSLHSKPVDLGQDLFVPCKKAFDAQKKFIGYIYKAVNFGSGEAMACIDIASDTQLSNLPRIKCLIRLILQIQEITKGGKAFIQNPFTHVFLSKEHKGQVQILNIEFLAQDANIQDTKKWTSSYVHEVFESDSNITAFGKLETENLVSVLRELESLSNRLKKYCQVHNLFYPNDMLFCPKCISKQQIEDLVVEKVDKQQITGFKPIGEGGEAIVYPYGTEMVAKVFKENIIDYDFKTAVIVRVLGKKKLLEKINRGGHKYTYVYPEKILANTENFSFFGYVMSKANGMPISRLKDKDQREKHDITRKDILEILITVGKGIKTLHENNIYIGDLNGNNILFDKENNVYFLDFDGMGIDEFKAEFYTEGYIDPISSKNQNITMKDDWYSFAVQAFYYLTLTHPFNGIYTVRENGRNISLDIVTKMERRISLLGNHGMEPPKIAEPWDWMNEELVDAFLKIFEGDYRESIVPELIQQYEDLYNPKDKALPTEKELEQVNCCAQEEEGGIIRINPKFVAKRSDDVFYHRIRATGRIISKNCLISAEEGIAYIRIDNGTGLRKITEIENPVDVQDILLSEDEKIAFVIYKEKVTVLDLDYCRYMHETGIQNNNAIVNGNTLYYVGNASNTILQMQFTSGVTLPTTKSIEFMPEKETKYFSVRANSKFVIIKRVSDTVDEIYCNSQKLCDISYSDEDVEYNIIYDEFTSSWLVINSEGSAVIISPNGTYRKFELEEGVNSVNIRNIFYHKGVIYIPSDNALYVTTRKNDQITTKKMECHKIMTPNSKLFSITAEGFSVLTDNILYEVRMG